MAENYVWKESAVSAAKAAQNVAPAVSNTISGKTFANTLGANESVTKPKEATTPTLGFADYFKQLQTTESTPEAPKAYDSSLGGTIGQGAFTQALQTAQNQLGAQATGDSTSSRIARAGFNKAAQEATRGVLETSALGGRAQTGQIAGDQFKFVSNTILPQRANLEAQLQSQEEQQAATERQQGFQNLFNLEQLGHTAKQFGSKQEFDIWATKANLSDADRERAFNLALEDSKQKFQKGERIAANEFSLYKDSLNREFEEKQAEYDRQAQIGLVDKNLEADLKRIRTEQEFADARFFAQMAQENDLAMQQLGIDKEKLALSKLEVESAIKNEAERLGIDKAAFESENIMNQIELASIMVQMDDSDEMTEMASNIVMNAIESAGYLKQGTTTDKAQIIDENGKLSGTYKGVDLATWSPTSTDVDTAEKLATSKDWDKISKASGVVDLKNDGVDSSALDSGETVELRDAETIDYLLKNLYETSRESVSPLKSKRAVVNINGVPYLATSDSGRIGEKTNNGWVAHDASIKLIALDGSGTSSKLKFNISTGSLYRFVKENEFGK